MYSEFLQRKWRMKMNGRYRVCIVGTNGTVYVSEYQEVYLEEVR
jgi:hypothetical protein